MGMSFQELEDISPRSLLSKIKGFQKRQQIPWELMRLQTFWLLLPNIPKKERQQLEPRHLFQFPWEEDVKKESQEQNEVKHQNANKIWELIDDNKNRDVGQ